MTDETYLRIFPNKKAFEGRILYEIGVARSPQFKDTITDLPSHVFFNCMGPLITLVAENILGKEELSTALHDYNRVLKAQGLQPLSIEEMELKITQLKNDANKTTPTMEREQVTANLRRQLKSQK